MGRACILVLASLVTAVAAAVAQAPVGADALHRIEDLPLLRPYAWAYQSSSHDRGARNYDWTGFLGYNGDEKIILDVKGPGCVYRMWFTANTRPLNGELRFYFDGSAAAAFTLDMEPLFAGSDPRFPSPLVGNPAVSSGGYYCYVPIPFRSGCRITHTNTADLTYYNITYHRYATDQGVNTFDGTHPLGQTVSQWINAGGDPKPSGGNQTIARSLSVPAGGFTTVATLSGSGVVQQFELNLPQVSDAIISSLRLRSVWDGASTGIDAPLGTFFGSGLAPGTVQGLLVGMNGTRLYCYFPMPYRTYAQFVLENTSGAAIGPIDCTVVYRPQTVTRRTGRFHALYNKQSKLPEGTDYSFVNATGSGHLVGVSQTLRGTLPGQWYLEGDERFYVDGALTPALHGTGTEDFFNGGWYFERGLFTRPLHGMTSHLIYPGNFQANSCYRLLVGDLVPFRDALRAGIEHGGWNEDPAAIESVAYVYRSPRSTMFLTDEVDVGDPISESAHGYAFARPRWNGTTFAEYHGNSDGVTATDTGRSLEIGGYSQFTVSTDPPGGYVVLRRRLNHSIPRQNAEVYVDGAWAGTWYDGGSSASDGSRGAYPAFRDSEFFVPPSLSAGRKSLDVRIVNTSAESEWTEYRYWAFVIDDGTAPLGDFDRDGDVDLEDFAFMQRCMSGPLVAPSDARCRIASLDDDADVDSADAGLFLNCLSGSGVAAPPQCMD